MTVADAALVVVAAAVVCVAVAFAVAVVGISVLLVLGISCLRVFNCTCVDHQLRQNWGADSLVHSLVIVNDMWPLSRLEVSSPHKATCHGLTIPGPPEPPRTAKKHNLLLVSPSQ